MTIGCEICKRDYVRLVQDHDHVTGKKRGMICDTCNYTFLGSIEHFQGRQITLRAGGVHPVRYESVLFKIPAKILEEIIAYLDRYDSTFIMHIENGIRIIKRPYLGECLRYKNEKEEINRRRPK